MLKIDPIDTKNFLTAIVRVPYKTGETAVLRVTENDKCDIVEITGKVLKKGKKVGAKIKYRDRNGFDLEKCTEIANEFETKAKEGYNFFLALTKAEKEALKNL